MEYEYDNLINELFNQFPELESAYRREGEYIEGLPHLCYSIVFVPFIKQALHFGEEKNIRLICRFMEIMATSEDEKVQEVLAVSVLENMVGERNIIRSLRRYLGINTLKILTEMEKEYGW